MKLVLITCISEYEETVRKLLQKAKVFTYSHTNIKGYRDGSADSLNNNWFATEMNETDSIMFFSYVPKEHVELLKNDVVHFNTEQDILSKIHLSVIHLEESI